MGQPNVSTSWTSDRSFRATSSIRPRVVVDAPQLGPERHVSAVGSPASQLAGPFGHGEALNDVIRPGERVVPSMQRQQQRVWIFGGFGKLQSAGCEFGRFGNAAELDKHNRALGQHLGVISGLVVTK